LGLTSFIEKETPMNGFNEVKKMEVVK